MAGATSSSEVDRLVAANRLKEARRELERGGTVRDANVLVRALCSAREVAEAKSVVLNLRNFKIEPNARCYEAVIAALSKEKRLDEATTFLADMKRQGDTISAEALHTVIWTCLAENRYRLAKDLFSEHISLIGNASDKLVVTMLSGYVANGKAGEARQLLYDMKTNFGISPEVSHLNLAIRASLRAGEAWSAWELAQFAHQTLAVTVPEAAVVDIFQCLAGQKELLALTFLCEELEFAMGIKPNWNLFVPLLEALGKALFVFELIDVLDMMEERYNIPPNVEWLNDLLDELCQNVRLDLAEEVLRNVNAKWNVKSFSGIIREASTIYDMDKVNEYFKMMEILKIRPDIFAWNCRLRCEYNINGSRGRDRVRRMIESSGVKFDSYTTKVLKFSEAKRPTAKLQRRKIAYETLVNRAISAGQKQTASQPD